MKRKILLFLICLTCLFFVGCNNKHDTVEIWNKTDFVFDDIIIDIKSGYFYDRHEKFVVNENTVGVTIYFMKKNTEWNLEEGD